MSAALRVAQPVYLFAWPKAGFLWAGARQASLTMSCCIHIYLHHVLVMYSKAAVCMLQNMCTADHN
jgi:hypothetical protein